jgi:hypothetical protein
VRVPPRTLGGGRRRAPGGEERRRRAGRGGVTGAEENTSFSGRVYYVLLSIRFNTL